MKSLYSIAHLAAPAPAPRAESPAVVVAEKYSAEAEVLAVDYAGRTVTLKTSDGLTSTLPMGPEVKNLAQLKKGDKVQAQYSTALTVALKKKGAPAYKQEKTDLASAAAGQKPAAAAMHQINFAADIIKLDAKTGALTVKGAGGKIVDLKVRDLSVLEGYGVGDQVEGTFLEVLAIAATTPGAAK
jgi:Cu/Ag efflux protein CusF